MAQSSSSKYKSSTLPITPPVAKIAKPRRSLNVRSMDRPPVAESPPRATSPRPYRDPAACCDRVCPVAHTPGPPPLAPYLVRTTGRAGARPLHLATPTPGRCGPRAARGRGPYTWQPLHLAGAHYGPPGARPLPVWRHRQPRRPAVADRGARRCGCRGQHLRRFARTFEEPHDVGREQRVARLIGIRLRADGLEA